MMGKPILEFMTNTFTLREKRGERKDMNLLDKLAFEMSVKEMKKLLPEFKQFCEVAAEQMKMYYDSLA